MMYAKIDSQGNAVEFPYRELSMPDFRPEQEIPADAVEVDTQTNRPADEWDKKLFYDNVEKIGDTYILNYRIEERFSNPEDRVNRFRQLVTEKRARNERWLEEKSAELNNTYPFSEQQSWAIQREEALKYNDDNTFVPPLLSVIAENRGITISEMVSKVLVNVDFYNNSFGAILGKYQKNKDLLNSVDFDVEDSWSNFYLVAWE